VYGPDGKSDTAVFRVTPGVHLTSRSKLSEVRRDTFLGLPPPLPLRAEGLWRPRTPPQPVKLSGGGGSPIKQTEEPMQYPRTTALHDSIAKLRREGETVKRITSFVVWGITLTILPPLMFFVVRQPCVVATIGAWF